MKRVFVLLFLFGNTFQLLSQNNTIDLKLDQDRNLWQKFTYDVGNMVGGMGYAYSRPLYWKQDQWTNFSFVLGGTAGLYLVDDEIDQWANQWRSDVPRWLADYGNEYGSPNNNYMVTGLVYLTGLFTNDDKLRRTGVLLISSASAAGLFQQVTKRILGRARPRADRGGDVFKPFHLDRVRDFDSFPSGHTMLGFTNAYAIAKQFENPWVKAGIYTIGAIPGFVRIVDRFHWVSDVAFSIAVSIFIVEAVDKYLDKKYDKKYNDVAQKKQFEWDLQLGLGSVGVVLRF